MDTFKCSIDLMLLLGHKVSMDREVSNGGETGSHIRTFLRIRPSKQPSGYIKMDEHDTTRVNFHVPVETKDGEVRTMIKDAPFYTMKDYECVGYDKP